MIASEDVFVSVTKGGYVKRTSLRSYSASSGEGFAIRDEEHLVRLMEVNTTDKILLFTNKGRYVCLPVHALHDIRWKDIGQHLSKLCAFDRYESKVSTLPVRVYPD